MKSRKRAILATAILWPFIAFMIEVALYNNWFDRMDNPKPGYSPEFDQETTGQNIAYWGFILVAVFLEIVLIKLYKECKSSKVV